MWACTQHSVDVLRQILACAARFLAPLQLNPRPSLKELGTSICRIPTAKGTPPACSPGTPNVSPWSGTPAATARNISHIPKAGANLLLTGVSRLGMNGDGGKDDGVASGPIRRDLQDQAVPAKTPRQVTGAGTAAHFLPVYLPPRYPIVLCHGLFGYDIRGPQSIPWLQYRYWSDIKEALEKLGAIVLTTSVPATGDVVERAAALDAQLRRHMAGRDVNLVAHSMGGLDCRYLTFVKSRRDQEGGTRMEEGYRIRSLTTLATPHRGSPFMDWCRDYMGVGWPTVIKRHFLGLVGTLEKGEDEQKGDIYLLRTEEVPRPEAENEAEIKESPKSVTPTTLVSRLVSAFDYPAYACLTTDFCKSVFNRAVPDVPGVSYYSYGAAIELPMYDALRFPWEIVQRKEGPNDGIVSVQSARWGRYWETLEADHFDLTKRCRSRVFRDPKTGRFTVCPKKRKPQEASPSAAGFDAVEFVCRMATRLHHEGF